MTTTSDSFDIVQTAMDTLKENESMRDDLAILTVDNAKMISYIKVFQAIQHMLKTGVDTNTVIAVLEQVDSVFEAGGLVDQYQIDDENYHLACQYLGIE